MSFRAKRELLVQVAPATARRPTPRSRWSSTSSWPPPATPASTPFGSWPNPCPRPRQSSGRGNRAMEPRCGKPCGSPGRPPMPSAASAWCRSSQSWCRRWSGTAICSSPQRCARCCWRSAPRPPIACYAPCGSPTGSAPPSRGGCSSSRSRAHLRGLERPAARLPRSRSRGALWRGRRGAFLYTLTLTDIATTWTECLPLLHRPRRPWCRRWRGRASSCPSRCWGSIPTTGASS